MPKASRGGEGCFQGEEEEDRILTKDLKRHARLVRGASRAAQLLRDEGTMRLEK
jgi:hypothetical protein